MATTTTASTPSRRPSSRRTGTIGMISSCMFSSAPIDAKKKDTTGIASRFRRRKALAIAPTRRPSVPRPSTTTHAPPTKRIAAMTSPPSTNPCGSETSAPKGPTGDRSTSMIRTGDDDTPAGHGIVASIELSRRQCPRQRCRDHDAAEQQDERMGNPQPHAREVYRKIGRVTFYLERRM